MIGLTLHLLRIAYRARTEQSSRVASSDPTFHYDAVISCGASKSITWRMGRAERGLPGTNRYSYTSDPIYVLRVGRDYLNTWDFDLFC